LINRRRHRPAQLSSAQGPTAWRVPDKEDAMGRTDKAKNKADELKGQGKTDQAKGNLKQAGEKIKDAFI
jgi:uncharacterized protein YjbJ (UPF0337 family)